jgi:hypothetical protein
VRVRTSSLKGSRVHVLRVNACRFSTRWKAFSGSCPSCFHRQGEAEVLWLAGQHRDALRKARDDGQQIGRISDSDSDVPAGDEGNVRGRRGLVKAPQGTEKAHGESASSALEKAPVSEVRPIAIG